MDDNDNSQTPAHFNRVKLSFGRTTPSMHNLSKMFQNHLQTFKPPQFTSFQQSFSIAEYCHNILPVRHSDDKSSVMATLSSLRPGLDDFGIVSLHIPAFAGAASFSERDHVRPAWLSLKGKNAHFQYVSCGSTLRDMPILYHYYPTICVTGELGSIRKDMPLARVLVSVRIV